MTYSRPPSWRVEMAVGRSIGTRTAAVRTLAIFMCLSGCGARSVVAERPRSTMVAGGGTDGAWCHPAAHHRLGGRAAGAEWLREMVRAWAGTSPAPTKL